MQHVTGNTEPSAIAKIQIALEIRLDLIALAPKPVLFVVSLSKGYGAQLIDSSLLISGFDLSGYFHFWFNTWKIILSKHQIYPKVHLNMFFSVLK